MKEVPATKGAGRKAIGPYSQAIAAGGWVFVSGQIPLGPDGALVGGDIGRQTGRCLSNIEAILGAAGLGLADVVKTTVYLTDLRQFPAMNEAYARSFKPPFPARATVQVSALPKGAAIEIEAVALQKARGAGGGAPKRTSPPSRKAPSLKPRPSRAPSLL